MQLYFISTIFIDRPEGIILSNTDTYRLHLLKGVTGLFFIYVLQGRRSLQCDDIRVNLLNLITVLLRKTLVILSKR